MIGTLLNNRYQITKELGEGGFGKTFLAIDTHSPAKRKCVIKQLKPINNDPKTEQLIKDRFGREAVVLETLGQNAPGNQIPRLDAYFEEKKEFYLVQEFVEGESLRQKLLNNQRFSENDVKNILINILPVLEYIHSRKIIHRDIKPDNIIIRNSDNKPVLIDFGAVKETLSTTVTMGGNVTSSIIIGTQGYMPSEQAAGRPVNSSDLYSLAMTLIELLTGKMPQELDINQQTSEIEWKIGINVSRELGEILDKAISYVPRDRFSSASLMLNAVQSQNTQNFAQSTNNYSPQSTEVSKPPIIQNPTIQVTPPQPYQQPYQQPVTNTNNQSFPQWLTAVIIGSIIGGFLLVGLYLFWQQNKPQNVGQNTPTPAPTNTPFSPPSPPSTVPTNTPQNPPPEIEKNYNLTGVWSGIVGSRDPERAELEIINQERNTFTGEMRVYKKNGTTVYVKIQGNYNQTYKTIIMDESSASNSGWALARNRGTVADDGLFMSGNSIDAKKRIYKWSFRKNN